MIVFFDLLDMPRRFPVEVVERLATDMIFESPALEGADSAWNSHVPFAFWLITALRPRTLVELGVHTGVSYCAFCQAIQRQGLATAAYGIDTWAGDAHAGHYDGRLILERLRDHHDPRYLGFSHLIQSSFDGARALFPDASVDLLHIDGYHTYAAVRHDFETWLSALSNRAVLLLHDVTVRGGDFGVWRLWDEIKTRYPTFLFPYGHGLGVVGVGSELPESVAWLLRQELRRGVTDDDIVAFFAPLGSAVEARSGWLRSQRALRETQAQLGLTQAQLDDNKAQLVHSQKELEHTRLALQEASHTLAAIQQSTSWRITAPLRSAVTAGRTVARKIIKARPRSLVESARSLLSEPMVGMPVTLPLASTYPLRDRWYDAHTPEVSLIVLNYNRPDLCITCLDSIWRHTEGRRYEVVLVDNGSVPERLLQLAPLTAGAQLLRVGVNRFFGEGNNLGFEASKGAYVVFLNNDVTVTPGWLQPLIACLQQDTTVGACGPMMLYPDGRLLEAGARIRPDGSSEQFGKGGDPNDPQWGQMREVEYISAAALAMRREVFDAALGFDLCYEPAYYEDSDLCMKVRQLGYRVLYCPGSRIVHQESATSRELSRKLFIEEVIAINRQRFLARWGAVLRGEAQQAADWVEQAGSRSLPPTSAPKLLLFTPYPLVPGGGERYLLTLAAGLAHRLQVTLATPQPYSRLRLRTIGRELSLDLENVAIATWDELQGGADFDYAVVMGNEALPMLSAPAHASFYLCQFPFPADANTLASRWSYLDRYQGVVVYSHFVQRHYQLALKRLGKTVPPVHVIYPPATTLDPAIEPSANSAKRSMVVGVGRFFRHGHAKRHDLMIQALRDVLRRHPGAELHLAGTLAADPDHLAYFRQLQKMAEGLPVHLHANASPHTIERLYAEASVYWHLAGYGVDESTEAHRCEHFGITVVEAMSRGCIPVVVGRGGPAEIVTHGVDGFHVQTLDQLIEHTRWLLSRAEDDPELQAMRQRARQAASRYTAQRMVASFDALLGLSRPEMQPGNVSAVVA